MLRRTPDTSRRGLVLLAVLVVVVLLSLAAYRYNDLMSAEFRAAYSSSRAVQARSFADSGVAYTAALLAAGPNGPLVDGPLNNPSMFQAIEVPAANGQRAGRFWVVSPNADGSGHRYGLTDEGGKINLNSLLDMDKGVGDVGKALLLTVPNMTEDVANAILDWMDPNTTTPRSPGGAKDETYSGKDPPYKCKNGPLDSLEELLLVQGVTADLLFGADRNRNGLIDSDETAGGDTLGWSAYLTVFSREVNADSNFQQRINVNNTDVSTLGSQLDTIDAELGLYILAYRLYGGSKSTDTTGETADSAAVSTQVQTDLEQVILGTKQPKKIKSLWDLVNSQVSVSTGSGMMKKSVVYNSPLNSPDKQKTLLPLLMDLCSISEKWDLNPKININTAPDAVVTAIATAAGLADTDVTTILTKRPDPTTGAGATGVFSSTAWLVTEAGLPPATVKKLERYITGRSQVYRFQVVGKFDGDKPGPMSRLEAVVDSNNGRPRIVYWRDLSELGKGFDLGSP